MTMEWEVDGMTKSIKSRNVFRFIDVNDAMKLGLVAGVWSFASIGSLPQQQIARSLILGFFSRDCG